MTNPSLLILAGDGIGPEVMAEVRRVIDWFGANRDLTFDVTEDLGFDLSDDGEHDFLWIEKRDANTAWVARQLARHAGVSARDVGYAGLKDRQAVTTQWFSIHLPGRSDPDWAALDEPQIQVLECTRNRRKLRRGVHRANRFRLRLRSLR